MGSDRESSSPPLVTNLSGQTSPRNLEMSQSPKSPADNQNQDRQEEEHAPLQVDVSLFFKTL